MNTQKILIIEDDTNIQTMYRRFFELEKYTVETATDGLVGLEMARKSLPDLIALDLMVPSMDGIKVLTELKGDPKTHHIPVIVLTNIGEESVQKQCLDIGATAYMIKLDFSPSEVVEKVRYYLSSAPAPATDTDPAA